MANELGNYFFSRKPLYFTWKFGSDTLTVNFTNNTTDYPNIDNLSKLVKLLGTNGANINYIWLVYKTGAKVDGDGNASSISSKNDLLTLSTATEAENVTAYLYALFNTSYSDINSYKLFANSCYTKDSRVVDKIVTGNSLIGNSLVTTTCGSGLSSVQFKFKMSGCSTIFNSENDIYKTLTKTYAGTGTGVVQFNLMINVKGTFGTEDNAWIYLIVNCISINRD